MAKYMKNRSKTVKSTLYCLWADVTITLKGEIYPLYAHGRLISLRLPHNPVQTLLMDGLCYLLEGPERGVVPLDNVAVSDVLDSREGASHALLEHFREPCEHHLQHIATGSIPHGPNREFEGLDGLEEVGLLEGADPLGHCCFECGLSHHIG